MPATPLLESAPQQGFLSLYLSLYLSLFLLAMSETFGILHIPKPATPLVEAHLGGLFFMGNQKVFSKPPFSVSEQLALLQSRGLIVSNENEAKHCLETVGYYRFSGYFPPFQSSSNGSHVFRENVTFELIWDIYVFDRELRLLLLDSLERIEIALRSAMSNHLAKEYGPQWYLLENCFSKKWIEPSIKSKFSPCDYFKRDIKTICQDQKEEFLKHYFSTYSHPPYPPSWMIMECLSFGQCTSLFRYLAKVSDKAAISKVFGYHPKVIESCLEALRYTRNICAHHTRLWNRWFVVIPKHMRAFESIATTPRSLHQQLIIIEHLHRVISPHSHWKTRLFELFEKHQTSLPCQLMGFQKDWQNDPFWKL